MFKRLFKSIKYFFTRGKNKPVYRSEAKPVEDNPDNSEPTISTRLRDMYPNAQHREDMNLFHSPYKFKFDSSHYFIVHFTAGWRNRKFKDFAKRFLEKGLNTMYLDESGILWQQAHGDRCGYHTGSKSYVNGKNISKKCAGVEIACGGKLKNGKTWFNQTINTSDKRSVTTDQGYVIAGDYQKFTSLQEKELARLLKWVISKGLPPENILGHDEIRKRGEKKDRDPS